MRHPAGRLLLQLGIDFPWSQKRLTNQLGWSHSRLSSPLAYGQHFSRGKGTVVPLSPRVTLPGRSSQRSLAVNAYANCRGYSGSSTAVAPDTNTFDHLNPDQQQLVDSVDMFCREEVEPRMRSMDDVEQMSADLIRALFGAGFMGFQTTEEFGGTSGTFVDFVLTIERLAKFDPSVAAMVDIHNSMALRSIDLYGTTQQKQQFLPRLCSDTVGSFCLSESNAGSDAFSLKARAVHSPAAATWTVEGAKQWVSNSAEAGIFILFATEDPDKGRQGISAFIVDATDGNIQIGAKLPKLGLRASSTCEVYFDSVTIPEDRLLGVRGQGYRVAAELLNEGRVGIAGQMVGLAQGAFETAIDYVTERKQFGSRLVDFQGIQFQLAEMATSIQAARLLTYNAAQKVSSGCSGPLALAKAAAMAKLFASRTAQQVSSRCIDLMGGTGFVRTNRVEKFFRDAKAGAIYEGADNIQLLTIAKVLVGASPRAPRS